MFSRSNTQNVVTAVGTLVVGSRLARTSAALLAAGVACAALAASPAMASEDPLDSRAIATEHCVPRGHDAGAELEPGMLEAAVDDALMCIASTSHPTDTSDASQIDGASQASKLPEILFCEVGTSPNYIAACAGHTGPEWVSCVMYNSGWVECHHAND